MFLLIELNEFNANLLAASAHKYNLNNIKELLNYNHYPTIANECEERFGLDPWVQWVSVHIGLAAKDHKIGHLGETSTLAGIQIWEKLGGMGFKTGVWGPMNSRRGNSLNNLFYFPDPWSFNEVAYPKRLNAFLALPRYYSKNYEKIEFTKLFNNIYLMIFSIFRELSLFTIIKIIYNSINVFRFNGLKNSSLFLIFDYINSFYFKNYSGRYKPDFKLIFLNSIAHFQHHDWIDNNSIEYENSLKICMKMLDKTLLNILSTCNKNTTVMLSNSFSQINSFNENKYLYRQIDPQKFLREIDSRFLKLEQGMTNDGIIYFANEEDLLASKNILSNIKVGDKNAFHVEILSRETNVIFYQFIIWDDLEEDSIIHVNGRTCLFYKYFVKVTKRTGKHAREGDVYINRTLNSSPIKNYDIYKTISDYFQSK